MTVRTPSPRPLDDRAGPLVADARSSYGPADVMIATVLPIAIMIRIPIVSGITIGDVAAILLAPVWVRALGRYRFSVPVLILVFLTMLSGIVLTALDVDRTTDLSLLITNSSYIFSIAVGAGSLLWSRSVIGPAKMAVFAGIGVVLRAVMIFEPGQTNPGVPPNPWKFFFELPTMILVLALAAWTGKRWIELAALGVLGATDLLADSRTATAIVLMTVALIAWQSRPTGRNRRGSTVRTLLGIGALGAGVYMIVTALIFSGALGQAALERSEAQIEESGSLLTGGRPELGASTALITQQPLGYGAGTLPTTPDILVAKSGMATLGYDPNNGYVENFLFGYGYEVHSVTGDLWIRYGLLGAVFAAALVAIALLGSGSRVASRSATALLVYLSIRILWDLAFGPFYSMIPVIILLIALALPERAVGGTAPTAPHRHLSRSYT
jgi:hypothetical protein